MYAQWHFTLFNCFSLVAVTLNLLSCEHLVAEASTLTTHELSNFWFINKFVPSFPNHRHGLMFSSLINSQQALSKNFSLSTGPLTFILDARILQDSFKTTTFQPALLFSFVQGFTFYGHKRKFLTWWLNRLVGVLTQVSKLSWACVKTNRFHARSFSAVFFSQFQDGLLLRLHADGCRSYLLAPWV